MSYKKDVYIINLESRKDRWGSIINDIKNNSKLINPIRFNTIKIDRTVYRVNKDKKIDAIGEIGCALSHITLLEMAKKKKMPYIIVFEDDTKILVKDFDIHFNLLMDYLNINHEWDMFNGNPSGINENNIDNSKIIHPYPLITNTNGMTTNFIIYSERIYDKLIGAKKNYIDGINFQPFDVFMRKVANKKITYWPILTTQVNGKSDIRNVNVKYEPVIMKTHNTLTDFINKNLHICDLQNKSLRDQIIIFSKGLFIALKKNKAIRVINSNISCFQPMKINGINDLDKDNDGITLDQLKTIKEYILIVLKQQYNTKQINNNAKWLFE